MQRYVGHCQCGAVRYHVDMVIDKVYACNCSMCKPAGTLLVFVPGSQFVLEQGEEALKSYKFNKMHIDHVFCATCGIKSFAHGKRPDGSDMVAVNVRCLDGVDPWKLSIEHVDGASR